MCKKGVNLYYLNVRGFHTNFNDVKFMFIKQIIKILIRNLDDIYCNEIFD